METKFEKNRMKVMWNLNVEKIVSFIIAYIYVLSLNLTELLYKIYKKKIINWTHTRTIHV